MGEIPRSVSTALAALTLSGAQREGLSDLNAHEWESLLSFCDRAGLTIALSRFCDEYLPDWVRGRIDQNIADNTKRFERIKTAYAEFARAMSHVGAEHLVLKGFAQWPDFVEHPRFRVQSDIDVYCPAESLPCAQEVLFGLGYEPAPGINVDRADHIQPLIPRAQWEWRGNHYDPEIPPSFELHFCFWNERVTRLHPTGLDQFWHRRVDRRLDDLCFPALAPADNLAYLTLNVLRDTLRGPLPLRLVRELAMFLHAHVGDDRFWATWRDLHDDSLRRLEAISFRFALASFHCDLSYFAQTEIHSLPPLIHRWFEQYAHSPFAVPFNPNKDALWLHIGLLESVGDKGKVILQGLLPQIPLVDAAHVQCQENGKRKPGGALKKRLRYLSYLARRLPHHSGFVLPTIWRGIRWWWSEAETSRNFLTFLGASFLFNLGMYVFFFLYNLYLLDRGFKENFVGMITSAVTLGGVAGTLPSGMVLQRLGPRRTLVLCLALVSIVSALRTTLVSPVFLLVFAFSGGMFSVIWAVALSPTIARLTSEKNRTFGFSVVFFFGIAVGILGGLIGGRLPGWLVQLSPLLTATSSKEIALLLSCGIIALALLPASRLRLDSNVICERKTYTWNPFLLRFLVAMAIWSVAVGSFSPFFTIYFSRYWQTPLKHIGTIDSVSHIPQLLAILAAPLLFRNFGLVNGIACAQIATAIALACLASVSGPSAAIWVYMAYVAFQWMSEPALYSLLMSRLPPSDRAGASAVNFLAINGSQAVAMLLAGAGFLRFGYPVVIMVTAAISMTAALLFWRLLGERTVGASQLKRSSSGTAGYDSGDQAL